MMVHKSYVVVLVLALLAAVVSGCRVAQQVVEEPAVVDLTDIFPTDVPAVGEAERVDVDGQGSSEWLVFYHVDLVEGNPGGSPVAAAVYRPVSTLDKRVPPRLIPALLWLPVQGYLCLYTCEAGMDDVLTGSPGSELVIRDLRDEDLVGVALFRWEPQLIVDNVAREEAVRGGFVPLGHFRGDELELEPDRVTVLRWSNDRSNLAIREVYTPRDGRYYSTLVSNPDTASAELWLPDKVDVTFAVGPPEEPRNVLHPEKLVLAYYQNYRDVEEVRTYFGPDAWDRTNTGCANTVCGCTSARDRLTDVSVTWLEYEAELSATTHVIARVVCKVEDVADSTIPTSVTWTLQRQPDSTWQLYEAVVSRP